jgi:hypothetical protein
MCALSGVITACHGCSSVASPTTLAPVPPQQSNVSTGRPTSSVNACAARRVQGSSP